MLAALSLALLLAGCRGSGGTEPSPISPGGLGLTRETTHFLISYGAADASCIDAVAAHLEGNQQLSEGAASYEARLFDPASWAAIEPYVRADRIPTFSALEAGSSYGDNGGYIWSYTIVDFAMREYGRGTLRPWIDNRGDFDSTFGVGEEAFRARWIEYLKAHYSPPASG